MSFWSDNYQREERQSNEKFLGNHRCVIVDVEDSVSKSGKNMIIVSVKPSGADFKVKQYIVEGDYFNRNMTQLFDAFPEIGDGNFNFVTWVGAEGAANFIEDDNKYLKIKYFISAEKAADLPAFEGAKPERQTVTSITDEPEDSEDDLPWTM